MMAAAAVSLALCLLVPSVHSLSAHSPQDLLAFPQWDVHLSSEYLVNSSQLVQSIQENKARLLRTNTGQPFLCTVPSTTNDKDDDYTITTPNEISSHTDVATHVADSQVDSSDSHENHKKSRLEQRKARLERGLELLEPLKGSCLYHRQGWFTYAFCYGNEIRQFHAVRVPGLPSPVEDPNSDAYTLGYYASQRQQKPESNSDSQNPSLSKHEFDVDVDLAKGPGDVSLRDALSHWDMYAASKKNKRNNFDLEDENDDPSRYLVQYWRGGTICDENGLERSVEVQFHCNTQAPDRIALIREESLCRYVLVIHTPRLCNDPVFNAGMYDAQHQNNKPPARILCQPIVDKEKQGQKLSMFSLDPNRKSEESIPTEETNNVQQETQEETTGETTKNSRQDNDAKLSIIPMTLRYDSETGEIVFEKDAGNNGEGEVSLGGNQDEQTSLSQSPQSQPTPTGFERRTSSKNAREASWNKLAEIVHDALEKALENELSSTKDMPGQHYEKEQGGQDQLENENIGKEEEPDEAMEKLDVIFREWIDKVSRDLRNSNENGRGAPMWNQYLHEEGLGEGEGSSSLDGSDQGDQRGLAQALNDAEAQGHDNRRKYRRSPSSSNHNENGDHENEVNNNNNDENGNGNGGDNDNRYVAESNKHQKMSDIYRNPFFAQENQPRQEEDIPMSHSQASQNNEENDNENNEGINTKFIHEEL